MTRTSRLSTPIDPSTAARVALLGALFLAGACSSDEKRSGGGAGAGGLDAGGAGGAGATSAGGAGATMAGGSGATMAGGAGGSAGHTGPNLETVTAVIDADGGTLTHPTGAALDVPAGALSEPVTLSIQGALAPSAEVLSAPPRGQAFVLGPEGQDFLLPVSLTLPFDAALLPQGTPLANARVLIAPQGSTTFTMLATTANAGASTLGATTTHFSVVVPVAPDGEPLNLETSSLPSGVVGEYYGPVSLTVTGGTAPYTFSLLSGSAPQGMRFNEGAFSGTPQVPGTSTFTIQILDDTDARLEKALSLTILAADETDAGVGVDPDGGASIDGGSTDDGGPIVDGPELLLSDYELQVVALDDTFVYFLQSGSDLSRLPLAGGTRESMAGFNVYEKTELVGDYFYYASGSTLVRRHKDGSGTEETVGTPPNPYALGGWTVAGTTAWLGYFNLIATVPVTGGDPTTVVDPGGNIVACDGNHIVYSRFVDSTWGVWVAPAFGGAAGERLVDGSGQNGVLDGGLLYYSTGDGLYSADVSAAGADGGTPTLVAPITGSFVNHLILSDDDLVYVDGDQAKIVSKLGGSPVPLGEAGNGRVAANATHVYMTSMYPNGGLYRVER
jgi:hypothetical protein